MRTAASKSAKTRAAVWTAALFLPLAIAHSQGVIIPAPAHHTPLAGAFALSGTTQILVPKADADAAFAAHYLSDLWQLSNHINLSIIEKAPATPGIRFARSDGLPPEGYRLTVHPKSITVEASTGSGLFYGAMSLWQLLPAGASAAAIPAQRIDDAPRFAWRGLMLDSSRHFQSAAFVRSMIDWMARHKLNVLHWHLTDDQGWRVQIRRYPKLTSVGSWRDEHSYGGFYTQAEIKDIVSYAAERYINIVPEIDMPGHATAAIAAYPELGVGTEPLKVTSAWGVYTHLFNLEPSTFTFLDNVLDELMELFPSRYIHIGGDEAVKNEWNASPQIQARARELNIDSAGALQAYFTQRMGAYLKVHGRTLVGWDEILVPGLDKSAVVMSWRGVAGAADAARAGNDTVLSPQPMLYLDHRQSALAGEPPGRLDPSTTRGVYEFEAIDPKLDSAAVRHVLGIQANIWTEHINSEKRVEWMAWPRGTALAEVAWSKERNWPDFAQRLAGMFSRYQSLDLNYADSVFGIESRASAISGGARLTLANTNEAAGLATEIRYGIDRDPDLSTRRYLEPVDVEFGHELRAATFLAGKQVSRIWRQPVDVHTAVRHFSNDLKLCSDNVGLLLEPPDGERPIALDIMNPCWIEPRVNLTHGASIDARVAPLPFRYELVDDIKKVRYGDAKSTFGELEVHPDSCASAPIAVIPIPAPGSSELPRKRLPAMAGEHNLCLRFARPKLDPMWGLEWVEITE
ncbi:MAG TPA: beta-N-acetylhexosaminidase [Steroidobacteraceae bacterium]